MLNIYMKNSFWMLLDKIFSLISSFFTIMIVSRAVGPDGLGIISYAQAIVAICAPLCLLGMPQLIVKKISNDNISLLGLKYLCSNLSLVSLGVFMVVFFIFYYVFDYSAAYLIIFATILFQVQILYSFIYSAKSESIIEARTSILVSVVMIFLRLLGFVNEWGIEYFAFMILLDSLLRFFFLKYFLKLIVINNNNTLHFIDMIKEAFPFFISSLAIAFYMKVDQIMVASILGDLELGIYSVATRLTDVWLFFASSLSASFAPKLYDEFKSKIKYNKSLIKLLRGLFWFAILISLFTVMFSEFLVLFLSGDKFVDSARILNIYIFTLPFVYLNNGSWHWFVANSLQVYSMYRLLIGAVLNVVLNFIFIPIWGLEGAAISSVISYLISSYLINFVSRTTRGLFYIQTTSVFFIRRCK